MFLLHRLKQACKNQYYMWKNKEAVLQGAWQPQVMSLAETMNKIWSERISITRFGDGEFKWMLGIKQCSFQKDDENLQNLLKKTFSIRDERLLICIPDTFGDLAKYNAYAVHYWSYEMCALREKIHSLILDENYTFGNLNITRFYMDYIDKSHVEPLIQKWKQIFSQRRLYIIEGEFSRLGVGNNLFSTASSVQRILAPAQNAFSSYQNILNFVREKVPQGEETLILLALGPTATVLVPPLVQLGYQAIDIGHIDVEYEWYKLHAAKKIPLVGRYVNEAGGFKEEFSPEILKKYYEEIIAKIDC